MSEQNEVRHAGHCHTAVVPFNDCAGVKLPLTAGREKFQFPAVRCDQPFEAVPADILDDVLGGVLDRHHFGVFCVPNVQPFRCGENRETGEVSFDADALYLLNASLEVPVAVSVTQNTAPFGVALAALGLEEQQLLDGDFDKTEVGRRVLYDASDVVVVIVQPFVERVLASDRELLPADQAVGVLASELRVASLSAPALVDDFVCAPSVCEEG